MEAITVREAAQRLGVSITWVMEKLRPEGRLIPVNTINEYLERHSVDELLEESAHA